MLALWTEPETHSTVFVLVREEGGNKWTEEDKSKEQEFTKRKHRNPKVIKNTQSAEGSPEWN